jgi:hypothetical protein
MRSRAAFTGERPNEFISLIFVSVTEFGGFNGAESHKVFLRPPYGCELDV